MILASEAVILPSLFTSAVFNCVSVADSNFAEMYNTQQKIFIEQSKAILKVNRQTEGKINTADENYISSTVVLSLVV